MTKILTKLKTSKLSGISFLSVILVLGTVAPAFAAFLDIDDSVEAQITLSHDANWELFVISNGVNFGSFVPGVTAVVGETSSFTGSWVVAMAGNPDPGIGIVHIIDPITGQVSDIITAIWSTSTGSPIPPFDTALMSITVQSSAKCSDLGPLPPQFTGVVETAGAMQIQGSFEDPGNGAAVSIPSNLTIQFESGEECEVTDAEKTWTETDYNWDRICTETIIVEDPPGTFTDVCVADRAANINNNGQEDPQDPPNLLPDDDVLADTLDPDGDGTSDVVLQVKRNGNISNMNPGAIYALTTVEILNDLDMLEVEENYDDCTDTLLELLNQKTKTRNVKVAWADDNGDVTEVTERLYDPLDLDVVFVGDVDETSATVKINDSSILEEGNTVYVLVKFDDQLKNVPFSSLDPLECVNDELVTASIAGLELIQTPDATLKFTEKP